MIMYNLSQNKKFNYKKKKSKKRILQASGQKHFLKNPFKVKNLYLPQWKLRYGVIIYRLLRAKDCVSRKLYPAEM